MTPSARERMTPSASRRVTRILRSSVGRALHGHAAKVSTENAPDAQKKHDRDRGQRHDESPPEPRGSEPGAKAEIHTDRYADQPIRAEHRIERNGGVTRAAEHAGTNCLSAV